ncbi:hypothetical protein BT96DRAFT_930060 [Gymnopus androsaceus JB14]|uniref:Uncharacterized protein n=1 Tax=Gymnopus androsaceus JB14 TaxID=1447944 RepID=A0A6A4GC42_9AGAR|nr:hypothetical protein BT96DRAFT_930060 [Gymnopus androsaceus JB14]
MGITIMSLSLALYLPLIIIHPFSSHPRWTMPRPSLASQPSNLSPPHNRKRQALSSMLHPLFSSLGSRKEPDPKQRTGIEDARHQTRKDTQSR